PADAVTIWAASETLSRQGEVASTDADMRRREDALRETRRALGPGRARAAEQRGAGVSLGPAAEDAPLLPAPGSLLPPPRPAPPAGPENLAAREGDLSPLAPQEPPAAQIAPELYITTRPVRSPLDRTRDKPDWRRRADLTRLALAAGLV